MGPYCWPLTHCWPCFSSLLLLSFHFVTSTEIIQPYRLSFACFFFCFFWGYDGIMTFKTAYLILERLSRWFKACLVGSTHLLCCTTSGLFYVCVWDTLKHVWLRVHIRRWAVQVCFVDLWEMDAHSVQFCLPQSHSDSGLHTSGCKIRSVWFPVHIRNIMWGLLNILKWLKNMSEDVSFGARK